MLYLASTSPRRQSLLESAGIDFSTIPPGSEPKAAGSPQELARIRARAKARGAQAPAAGALILGVDTVVDLDGLEFGKPMDREAAGAMLAALSGREHLVHSAFCLRLAASGAAGVEREWLDLSSAKVSCDVISAAALTRYLDSGEWRGKAGAYGIQDEAASFVHLRCGELDTVIGLPLSPLRALLAKISEAAWS